MMSLVGCFQTTAQQQGDFHRVSGGGLELLSSCVSEVKQYYSLYIQYLCSF